MAKLSGQKLSEEKEERGGLGKKGQKGRSQKAAESTKYLMRADETHVTRTKRITDRPRQLHRNRLGTCKFKCGHLQSWPPGKGQWTLGPRALPYP